MIILVASHALRSQEWNNLLLYATMTRHIWWFLTFGLAMFKNLSSLSSPLSITKTDCSLGTSARKRIKVLNSIRHHEWTFSAAQERWKGIIILHHSLFLSIKKENIQSSFISVLEILSEFSLNPRMPEFRLRSRFSWHPNKFQRSPDSLWDADTHSRHRAHRRLSGNRG
jgi:hypothetical protein